ncbi:MAG: glycosyltransferase family 39 protein [Solirubrobacterales bacterium]
MSASDTSIAPSTAGPASAGRLGRATWTEALLLAALTALGLALRLPGLSQSLFGDELSTYWVVTHHTGFGGVWDVVRSDAEITPPLYFLAAKLSTQIDAGKEMLRLPSLIAGTATIPLTYLLGARTIGRRAGFVAAILVTLSPFMIYYSTEARGYAVMIALLLASTLCLLRALEAPGVRWWVAYGAFSCAAMYTHYTVAFALIAQALWALWFHPPARRAVLAANLGAALAYLPWASGAIADLNSPTTSILSSLQPFTWDWIRDSLVHWLVAHPYGLVGLGDMPGAPSLALLLGGIVVALCGLALARAPEGRAAWVTPGLVLVVALALATPLGEALSSAVSTNLLGTRNLAASWPGFALVLGAIVAGPRPRPLWIAATALVVASFAISAVRMLGASHRRPDTRQAAALIRAEPPGSTVVVDAAVVSPGPLSSLDVDLGRSRGSYSVVRLGVPQENRAPFGAGDVVASPVQVASFARAAAGRGGRVIVVGSPTGPFGPQMAELLRSLARSGLRVTSRRVSAGLLPVATIYLDREPSGGGGRTPRPGTQ